MQSRTFKSLVRALLSNKKDENHQEIAEKLLRNCEKLLSSSIHIWALFLPTSVPVLMNKLEWKGPLG
jgi:hypothetical protein